MKTIFYLESEENLKIPFPVDLDLDLEPEADDELNFEQIADYFTYDKNDLYFYKFRNFNFIFSKKNTKKVKSSIKLWTPILNELLSDLKFFSEISFILSFKNLSLLSKKGKFLNWWGRVKNFLKKNFVFSENIYYYKTTFFFENFFWIKWLKSTDWKIKIINLNNFYFSLLQTVFFIQILTPLRVGLKKKQFSWNLPKTKLFIAVDSLLFINENLNFWNKNFQINQTYLYLFNQTICFKIENKVGNLNEFPTLFSILKQVYLNININYIVTMIFSLLISLNNQINILLGLLFYFFKTLNKNFYLWNINFGLGDLFLILKTNHPTQNLYFKTYYWNKEWFIWSYAYNKNFKITTFNWYFTKNFTNSFILFSSILISFNNLNNKIFEFLKGFCLKKIHKFYWFQNTLLSKFESKIYYSNNLINRDNLSFQLFQNSSFISFNWLKLFYFELKKFPAFLNWYSISINFSIEPIFNYLIYFNKYINLDSITPHFSNNFFFTSNFFNGVFFFWKLYFFVYNNLLRNTSLLIGFEIWFFKKKFIFRWNKCVAKLFFWGFDSFSQLFFEFTESPTTHFLKKWTTSYWFWFSFFFEEFLHLATEFTSTEFEWLQEILWTKQFAELWVIKLTNYLKLMWEKNIDPGNIQYSPDFTQQHEFALLLKWGLELEILWSSRNIVEKRFYGIIKKPIFTNFIWKKINFFYNAKKPWFKKIAYSDRIVIYKTHLILNLSSVYEIIWLSLATTLASYQIFFKTKWQQLDNIHEYLPKRIFERQKHDIYKFLNFIHDRHFLIKWYWDYYIHTEIKKKISFPKMINKKVFNKFIEPLNIFFEIENFKNSFYFFIFKFFWWLKWWVIKEIKNEFLYETVYWLIFKRFSALHFPNQSFLDDWRVINLFITRFQTLLPLKNFIIYEKYLSRKITDIRDIMTDFSFNLDLCELDFIKIIFINNFNILKIWILNRNNFFCSIFKQKKLSTNIFYLVWNWIDKVFINFFTEFFYDQFANFYDNINILWNPIKWNWKKFVNGNLYSNISSENFSISFFSFLENWFICNKNYVNIVKKKFFLLKFEKFLLKKILIEIFYKSLVKIFFNLFLVILEIKKYKFNSDFFSLNYFLILTINSFVMKYIWSNDFRKQILKTFFLRLLKFPNDYKTILLTKLFLFEMDWMREFSNNLEIFFLNFLIQFLLYLNWK